MVKPVKTVVKSTVNQKKDKEVKVGSKPKKGSGIVTVEGEELSVIYPKRKVYNYTNTDDEDFEALGAMGQGLIKDYLGWEEEEFDGQFGDDFLLRDRDGKKVRCTKNRHNRWITLAHLETLVQKHLNRRWEVNGETIIIGKYGSTISAQHRLVSAVLAEQDRLGQNKFKWEANWPTEVTMETYLIAGIEETDAVVNTVDTGKPRTLSEVLFRSEAMQHIPKKDRKGMARAFGFAVQLLWNRTGAEEFSFAPLRTHEESLCFAFETHPRLFECVQFMFENNKGQHLSSLMSLGYASALLYLMGCCESDGDQYRIDLKGGSVSENNLDWSMWDKACQYWQKLAQSGLPPETRSKELLIVRDAIALLKDTNTGRQGSIQERMALLVYGWEVFKMGYEVVADDVNMEADYKVDEMGIRRYAASPNVGGLDLGDPDIAAKIRSLGAKASDNDDDEPVDEQDLDELQERKMEAIFEREQKNAGVDVGDDEGGSEEEVPEEPVPVKAGRKR